MKITEIKTFLVNANERRSADRPRGRNWVFCKIVTDSGRSMTSCTATA
jgi:L-alanine-DL-glutamate epimerase-like enolase superfamily enzyme